MTTFRATDIETGQATSYDADAPEPQHLGVGWRLEELSIAAIAPDAQVVVPTVYGGRRVVSKLEFIGLLGDPAYIAILTMARQSAEVEAWVKMIELTSVDPVTGLAINLDDPRTASGVFAIGNILATNGIVPEEWAQGVLNG